MIEIAEYEYEWTKKNGLSRRTQKARVKNSEFGLRASQTSDIGLRNKVRDSAERCSAGSHAFEDAFNISFAVQNPKDVDGVFLKKIIKRINEYI